MREQEFVDAHNAVAARQALELIRRLAILDQETQHMQRMAFDVTLALTEVLEERIKIEVDE